MVQAALTSWRTGSPFFTFFEVRDTKLGCCKSNFVGDRQFPSSQAPRTVEEWAKTLSAQKAEMGLSAPHALSRCIHELFLHVSRTLCLVERERRRRIAFQ
jgi:hypothetical protein